MFPSFPSIFPIQLAVEYLWKCSPEPKFSLLKHNFSKKFPISLLKNGEILPGKTKTHGNRWRVSKPERERHLSVCQRQHNLDCTEYCLVATLLLFPPLLLHQCRHGMLVKILHLKPHTLFKSLQHANTYTLLKERQTRRKT
jgi:hypothetical protein